MHYHQDRSAGLMIISLKKQLPDVTFQIIKKQINVIQEAAFCFDGMDTNFVHCNTLN